MVMVCDNGTSGSVKEWDNISDAEFMSEGV